MTDQSKTDTCYFGLEFWGERSEKAASPNASLVPGWSCCLVPTSCWPEGRLLVVFLGAANTLPLLLLSPTTSSEQTPLDANDSLLAAWSETKIKV